MSCPRFVISTVSLSLASLAMLAGCGDGKTPLQRLVAGPMAPVQGKVTLAGKPLLGGNVFFYREGEDQVGYIPSGIIDTKGNYSVNTSGEAGVPVGKYRVTVEPASEDKNQDMMMDVRYSSSTFSPLTVNVTENPTPGQYDLKIEAGRKR